MYIFLTAVPMQQHLGQCHPIMFVLLTAVAVGGYGHVLLLLLLLLLPLLSVGHLRRSLWYDPCQLSH